MLHRTTRTTWVVQHESDDEPIYVTPSGDTSDSSDYITVGTSVPMPQRLSLAQRIARLCNRSASVSKPANKAKRVRR